MNAAARKFWGYEGGENWNQAVRWIHHEDVERVENAHSRLFKFGGSGIHVPVRIKIQPHTLTQCNMACMVRRHPAIGCTLLISCIWVDEPAY